MNQLTLWSANTAETLLAPLGNRWKHTQGVVQRAQEIRDLFNEENQICLIATAYLHDIGYAPVLQRTGFHPLDGALYLKDQHQDRLASLVAYHSDAQFEARERNLSKELEHFPQEISLLADAITFCDMTTNSIGQPVSFRERLTDIFSRYDENHIVSRAIRAATPSLERSVNNIQQRIRQKAYC